MCIRDRSTSSNPLLSTIGDNNASAFCSYSSFLLIFPTCLSILIIKKSGLTPTPLSTSSDFLYHSNTFKSKLQGLFLINAHFTMVLTHFNSIVKLVSPATAFTFSSFELLLHNLYNSLFFIICCLNSGFHTLGITFG